MISYTASQLLAYKTYADLFPEDSKEANTFRKKLLNKSYPDFNSFLTNFQKINTNIFSVIVFKSP